MSLKMIKPITAEETHFIRRKVLRDDKDVSVVFKGDADSQTFHLGAFLNDKLIGISTFMQNDFEQLNGFQYQLRGMAILPEAQGLSYGNLLLKKSFKLLSAKGVDYLWCNAREVAIQFYQKNGFTIVGNSFDIEDVGLHYKMYLKLNDTLFLNKNPKF